MDKDNITFYDWCIANNKEYLLDEWDYNKNTENPKIISDGYGGKIWWVVTARKPHSKDMMHLSWDSTIPHRKRGDGCPYLSTPCRRVLTGFNDLLSVHPELDKYVDKEQNQLNNINYLKMSSGSTKSIYWKCDNGHQYSMKVSDKVHGNGCPICSGKRLLSGYNDFETKNPNKAKEWDYERNILKPNEVAYSTSKKYYFICKKGHSYYTSPNNLSGPSKDGCPYCHMKKALKGFNDLESRYPELVKYWDYDKNKPLLPSEVMYSSNKWVYWICNKCGNSWKAKIEHRIKALNLCPVCAGLQVKENVNDLVVLYPNLIREWDYYKNTVKPNGLAPSSKLKVWWKCKKGHSYKTSIISRARMKTGCPFCALPYQSSINEKIIGVYLKRYIKDIKFNYHPKFLKGKELDIYIPGLSIAIEYDGGFYHKNISKDIYKDTECEKNNIEMIRIRDNQCPIYDSSSIKFYCDKNSSSHYDVEKPLIELIKYINSKYNLNIDSDIKFDDILFDLLSEIEQTTKDNSIANSRVISEWNNDKNVKLNPEYIGQGSHIKVWWKCSKCGYEWKQKPYVRLSMGCGCPACGKQVVYNNNSIGDLLPHLVNEWSSKNEKSIFEYRPHSNILVWWKCSKCGYEWKTSCSHRTRGRNCPLCAHQVLVSGVNDLKTVFPEVAQDWDETKNCIPADKVSGGTNKKYYWKCHVCGYEWEAVVATRTKRNSRCPNCKRSAIDTNKS